MDINRQLVTYKNKSIRKWFANIWDKIKIRLSPYKLWDKDTEDEINRELSELVDLFGRPKFERISACKFLQESILELSKEELQVYNYLLNYNTVDFNERLGTLKTSSCKGLSFEGLQDLSEKDKLKAISIILSDSKFVLNDLNELNEYYEKRKEMCKQIIDDPRKADEEYEKSMNSEDEISFFPFGFLHEIKDLSDLDRIKYGIIEAKYGMSLEKAEILCEAFGDDIDQVEQSEETRVIKELKAILENNDIDGLRQMNLDEDYSNYEGTINIVSNLRNAYLHKYQETLYQVNENDYIGTQTVKTNGKKTNVKIYNVLGENNDKADFNILLTSLGGIYFCNHNYDDLKADWDRADENHTISCSYIGNDFLGVVDENYLLAFSDIGQNELLQARNQDAGTIDFSLFQWEDLRNNKFLIPQKQINSSKIYNELLVERKIERDGKLVNRTPTFAVFIAETIDDINDKKNYRWQETKRMAAELKIPVAVIDGTQCAKLEFQKVQEMVRAVREEKRMDLIPQIIHKLENNRAAQRGILKNVRNEVFSNVNIKKVLEEIIGTIITSDINTFNQGIEEFVKVTRTIKTIYSEIGDGVDEECKTYDYDSYLDRLQVLFSSRNELKGDRSPTTRVKTIDKHIQHNNGEIDL